MVSNGGEVLGLGEVVGGEITSTNKDICYVEGGKEGVWVGCTFFWS